MSNTLAVAYKYKNQTLTTSLVLIIIALLIEQTGRTGVSLILFTLAVLGLIISYTGYITYNTLKLHSEIQSILNDTTQSSGSEKDIKIVNNTRNKTTRTPQNTGRKTSATSKPQN